MNNIRKRISRKMDFKGIFLLDYSKIPSFKRLDDFYRQVGQNGGWIVWEMEKEGVRFAQYEVWRKKFLTNPDGEIIVTKPSDEDFGYTAWYVCGKRENCLKRIKDLTGLSVA